MLPAEQARGEALVALARTSFDPELRPIEEAVLRHSCAYEDPADWIADPDHPDPTRDEATGRPLPGSQLPEVRSTLIRWLLTESEAPALLEPRGLRIWNARLTEPLDLIGCTTPARLELRYCLVEAPILLANASLPTLSFRNSTLQQTLDGTFLKLHGPLLLDDITAAETLNLDAATIPAEVRIANTTLTATSTALSMAGASITNDFRLWPGFGSAGRVYLKGIHIGGLIALPGAYLKATGTALDLDDAAVNGGVYLTAEFRSSGTIRMLNAHIGGALVLSGGQLVTTENAVILDGVSIGGDIVFDKGFESAGTIRLTGAHIGGQLNCRGAKFTTTGIALALDGTRTVAVFLDEGFESAGTIRMPGAQIGVQLNCTGAKLTTLEEALLLDSIIVGADILLAEGFECAGTIRLSGAHIGGQLACSGASIRFLIGENMEVKGDLLWKQIKNSEQASLNLMGAKIKGIYDDHASWPAKANLRLNGLRVEDLSPLHAHHLDTTGRMAWLNRQPDSDLAEPSPGITSPPTSKPRAISAPPSA